MTNILSVKKHEKILVEHTQTLQQHSVLLEQHTEIVHRHSLEFIKHDDNFESLQKEIADFRSEMITQFEQVMTILKRMDEELIFTTEWIKRLDTRTEEHGQRLQGHDSQLSLIREKLQITA